MSELKSKHDGKTPKIIELRRQDKSWSQISTELDIPPRSLYHMRHTEGFRRVANDIWLQVWADIDKQRAIDSNYNLDQAIKNQLRLFAMIAGTSLDKLLDGPKELTQEETAQDITEDRKRKEKLVKDLREKFIPKERHHEFMEWLQGEVE